MNDYELLIWLKGLIDDGYCGIDDMNLHLYIYIKYGWKQYKQILKELRDNE